MKKTASMTITPPRPRNPLALLARQRAAGRHEGRDSRQRQAGRRALRTELAAMHAPPARPET